MDTFWQLYVLPMKMIRDRRNDFVNGSWENMNRLYEEHCLMLHINWMVQVIDITTLARVESLSTRCQKIDDAIRFKSRNRATDVI